ncbi:MAG: hypothetical protein IPK20_08295 [Betaproteobacteria bacterium]|nr:hypothetical protein [Betaproteobacteria bacterium]
MIRVYRRSDEPGREVAGLVEVLARGESVAFNGSEELWAVLKEAPERTRRRSGSADS